MARTGICMTKHIPGYRGFSGTTAKMSESSGGMFPGARLALKRKARKASRRQGRKESSLLSYYDTLAREARERAHEDSERTLDLEYEDYLYFDYDAQERDFLLEEEYDLLDRFQADEFRDMLADLEERGGR